MDIVTHSLIGANLAGAGLRQKLGPGTAVILIAASLLPDIDALWVLAGPGEATLGRHMLTHSVFALVPLALLAAVVFRRLYPHLGFGPIFGLALLGISLHILMDIPVSFGVGLLAPLSDTRFEIPLVFVVDPVILVVLAAPVVFAIAVQRPGGCVVAARAALTGVLVYFAFCGVLYLQAERLLARHLGPGATDQTYVVPEPLGPYAWKGVAKSGDIYGQVLLHPLQGRVQPLEAVRSMTDDGAVARVRDDPIGQRLESFLKLPVWRAGDDTVLVYDLRFRYATIGNEWDPFSFRFTVAEPKVAIEDWSIREIIENSFEIVRGALSGRAP